MTPRDNLEPSRAAWRVSTHSGNGGQCIEVAASGGKVLVRDTKNRQGPVLTVTSPAWNQFLTQITTKTQ